MAATRIEKFSDDSKALMASNNSKKLSAEIKKFRTWLQKHQNEIVSDGLKTKLFQTIDSYYRYCTNEKNVAIHEDDISTLLGDYLQLPEGKLLSSKDKRKVLSWHQSLAGCKNTGKVAASGVRKWSVIDINSKNELTMMSDENGDDMMEGFVVEDSQKFARIAEMFNSDVPVFLEISNETNEILKISTEQVN